MSKKKKQQITLRRVIGGSLSFLFILTLWGAVRWANYRQTFESGVNQGVPWRVCKSRRRRYEADHHPWQSGNQRPL